MKEYPSIETLFVRNPLSHALDFSQVRIDAATVINSWVATEKVDGMNIRVIFKMDTTVANGALSLEVRGRTDAAVLPAGVREAVERSFRDLAAIESLWLKELKSGKTVTFYGEAFGEKIQGNPLKLAGKRFRVFDILVGDRTWLSDAEVQSFQEMIGYTAVPLLGLINRLPRTETEVDAITGGGASRIATERVRPEGIVCRPLIPLFDTWGNRIIWKLTYREFDKIRSMQAAIVATIVADVPAGVTLMAEAL